MTTLYNSEIYEYFHDHTQELLDGYLLPAKDRKSWICPICNKGENGDGLKLDPKRKGILHCYSGRHDNDHPNGQFDGDIINLIGEQYGITDSKEQLKKACEVFNIQIERDRAIEWDEEIGDGDRPPSYAQAKNKRENSPKIQKMTDRTNEKGKDDQETGKEIKDALSFKNERFKDFITKARSNLNDPRALDYLKKRGISYETAQDMGIGYADYAEAGGLKIYNSLIFPTSYDGFATRMVNPNGKLKSLKASRESGAVDIPFGLIHALIERNKRYDDEHATLEPIFIVEGLLDAPSIQSVGADAIALNGTANIEPIITAYKEFDLKRPLILALDNDDAGRLNADRNYKLLKEAGIDVYKIDLIPQERPEKDANELLLTDKELLKKYVQNARKLPIQKFDAGLNKSIKDLFLQEIRESANRPTIRTGFKELDSQLNNVNAGLHVLGAISSLGKSALMLQIADQIAKQGIDVIYISLEMSRNELIARSVSRYTAKDLIPAGADLRYKARTIRDILDGKRWSNYTEPERDYIKDAINEYFDDTGEHLRIVEAMNLDVERLRRMIEQYEVFRGERAPKVLIIDYLQLLQQPKNENGKFHSMTDKQIIDKNIMLLKQLSRDFNMPIFAISSFNRESYNEEVSLKSFKESGAIEYGTDTLIALSTEHQADKEKRRLEEKQELETGKRRIKLKILKNRSGQRGGTILYDYYFRHNYFEEIGDERKPNKSLEWDDLIF